MSTEGDYTSAYIPDDILNSVIKDNVIFADIVGAGPMAAEDKGMVKNHWVWRVLIVGNTAVGQIKFGFNIGPLPSVLSDQGQYAGTSRGGSDPDHASSKGDSDGAIYSNVESITKPHAIGKDQDSIMNNASEVSSNDVAKASDSAKSKPMAPSIQSADDSFVHQPTEGAPVPSVLEVKVRFQTQPSQSTYYTCSFNLKTGTTFRELLDTMISSHMECYEPSP
ncbi:hypothetical protein FRC10_002894 [Ceratobasidium sp. 414]|nr:hypothetical protein FRC10_002894 [Ceratobasidium sp. 414]